ncbi:unnamed protein product [Malus baccata var. baccata]
MRGSMVMRLALIFSILSMAASIDDKCTACNAVAEELELGLSNVRFSIIPMFFDFAILHITSLVTGCSFIRFVFQEKPRNHLDMRHRLDSTGQRRGKVIDYRVSELRAVELLDGLCDKMQEYTLHKVNAPKRLLSSYLFSYFVGKHPTLVFVCRKCGSKWIAGITSR